jgi:hypothetical protein
MVAQQLKRAGKLLWGPERVARVTGGGDVADGATAAVASTVQLNVVVLGCDSSWNDWNTWSRRGAATYGRGVPAEVSQ